MVEESRSCLSFSANPLAHPACGENQGAFALARDPSAHHRTKHIELRNRFMTELVSKHVVKVAYVHTPICLPTDSLGALRRIDMVIPLTESSLAGVLWWSSSCACCPGCSPCCTPTCYPPCCSYGSRPTGDGCYLPGWENHKVERCPELPFLG